MIIITCTGASILVKKLYILGKVKTLLTALSRSKQEENIQHKA